MSFQPGALTSATSAAWSSRQPRSSAGGADDRGQAGCPRGSPAARRGASCLVTAGAITRRWSGGEFVPVSARRRVKWRPGEDVLEAQYEPAGHCCRREAPVPPVTQRCRVSSRRRWSHERAPCRFHVDALWRMRRGGPRPMPVPSDDAGERPEGASSAVSASIDRPSVGGSGPAPDSKPVQLVVEWPIEIALQAFASGRR